MTQNRSSAVMQQRSEANDSLDDFPTPCWATRAVMGIVARFGRDLGEMTVREPCANRGHMLRPLMEAFGDVHAFDVHDYGLGLPVRDFLFPDHLTSVDWTFMNPPFRLAEEFIMRAIATSREGVVVIARIAFLEGEDRFADLFAKHRPSHVLQFIERVVMLKGRMIRSGDPDPSKDKPKKKASTATAYCAVIFRPDPAEYTVFDWIPKCRRKLELDGDYPDTPNGLARLTWQGSKP